MRDSLRRVLAAAVSASALALAPAALAKHAPDPKLEAGAAEADITGPIGTPMFAYTARSYVFSPDANDPTQPALRERLQQIATEPDTGLYAKTFRPSDGIHTRLLARAIVLREGDQKYALAQAELGGLPYDLVQEVAGRIASTGIDAQHILLSATHTHSSVGAIWPSDNNGYAYVGGDAFDPRVFESTAQGIADAIIAANGRLKPARVGIGTSEITDASRNRSYDAFKRNVDVPKDEAARRAYSIDPTVTVLRVDRADGTPMALWSNFAVHPTSFGDSNLLFSGDNAGVAARLAEQAIERESSRKGRRGKVDVVDVWANSAQGDISPAGETAFAGGEPIDYTNSDASKAYLAGARDAAGIVEAWRAAKADMSGDLPVASRSFFWAFDGTTEYSGIGSPKAEPISPYPVLGQGGIVQDDGTCAPFDDFAGPGQGDKMPLLGGPGLAPVSVPVSFWRVGGLGIAAYPVEITKQMGVRIRDALLRDSKGALDRVVIAGLTNGYWSYTTTPEEYQYCGYEGSFTLFGREEGYGWLAAGNQLMKALLAGAPAPAGFPEPPNAGFATTRSTPPRSTPGAGTAVKQPADVTRYQRATFSWQGGDPQVDAQRGRVFVALQRQTKGAWTTVDTDDTPADTAQRASGDVWTETFQMDDCRRTGTYRFHVTGRAVESAGASPAPYTVDSKPFEVNELTISAGAVTVADGVASVRPLYPDPGSGALIALPRLVRGADVVFKLADGSKVEAADPDDDGVYTAPVSGEVTGVSVEDDCGNAN
jgi:neutral ceramidase